MSKEQSDIERYTVESMQRSLARLLDEERLKHAQLRLTLLEKAHERALQGGAVAPIAELIGAYCELARHEVDDAAEDPVLQ